MSNQSFGQLGSILQDLKTHASNLNKDLDEKDQREETQMDLSHLFQGFSQLRTVMSKLEKSDQDKLQKELQEYMSGQEDFLEYNRDVINILIEARKRTEQDAPVKDKVIENLPDDKKDDNIGNLFNSWGAMLKNVQTWIEQNQNKDTR